jgi:hypothetical protein
MESELKELSNDTKNVQTDKERRELPICGPVRALWLYTFIMESLLNVSVYIPSHGTPHLNSAHAGPTHPYVHEHALLMQMPRLLQLSGHPGGLATCITAL